MRNFDVFAFNDTYFAGSNGQTIYIYDSSENEITRFKDLIYVNFLAISPNGKILAVKSCEGLLAFYSLDELRLIKKLRFSKPNYSQDGNCSFSNDGQYFYNIEMTENEFISHISVYETDNFTLIKRVPESTEDIMIEEIYVDFKSGKCYLMGYDRHDGNENNLSHGYFVSEFSGDMIINKLYVTEKEHEYYTNVYLEGIRKNNNHTLALLHQHYMNVSNKN